MNRDRGGRASSHTMRETAALRVRRSKDVWWPTHVCDQRHRCARQGRGDDILPCPCHDRARNGFRGPFYRHRNTFKAFSAVSMACSTVIEQHRIPPECT